MHLLDDNQTAQFPVAMEALFRRLEDDGLAAGILERPAGLRAEPWLPTFVEHLARARFNDRPPPG